MRMPLECYLGGDLGVWDRPGGGFSVFWGAPGWHLGVLERFLWLPAGRRLFQKVIRLEL